MVQQEGSQAQNNRIFNLIMLSEQAQLNQKRQNDAKGELEIQTNREVHDTGAASLSEVVLPTRAVLKTIQNTFWILRKILDFWNSLRTLLPRSQWMKSKNLLA